MMSEKGAKERRAKKQAKPQGQAAAQGAKAKAKGAKPEGKGEAAAAKSAPAQEAPRDARYVPRMKQRDQEAIRPGLQTEFGSSNPVQAPRIPKIQLIHGTGRA